MSKEEILKYAKVFSEARGDTYKIHFVNENKTINEPDLWKETLNLINKQQEEIDTGKGYHSELQLRYNIEHDVNQKLRQENEELKRENKALSEMAYIKPIQQLQLPYNTPIFTSTDDFINKDKIKDKIKVFKKEGSQTSLIIARVLEELLEE